MRFTPLNDFRRPPKQRIHPGWVAAFIIIGIAGLILLFAASPISLNKILQALITWTFQWRQSWASTGWFWAFSLIWQLIIFVVILVIVIIVVLYTTLLERKLLAYLQIRQGPNRAGPWGIIQPFADMIKLLIKEDITPLDVDKWVYNLAPLLIFVPTLLVFATLPMTKGYIEMDHRNVLLNSEDQRAQIEKLYGYNILKIAYAKKDLYGDNTIQLGIGPDFIARATGSIGTSTIYTTPGEKRAYEQYEGEKPPPPRVSSEVNYITPEGQSVLVRTPNGNHILWIKGEKIAGKPAEGEQETAKYRLHLFGPANDKIVVEQGGDAGIIIDHNGTKTPLALNGEPAEIQLGDEALKLSWQTKQTYVFYLIPRDINVGILYIVAVTSLAVIVIFMAGWGSNNKWSLFGAMRSAAQMISYEVPMGLSLLGVVMMAGTTSMVGIVEAQRHLWFVIPQFLGFLIYFTCATAEVNRCPFDLPEAESELVAGFHTEYTGLKFGFFFLAEYANMFVVSALASVLFLGGWYGPWFLDNWSVALFGQFTSGLIWFFLKAFFFLSVLIWIRGTFPRLRVDHMMEFAWKALIPLALFNLLATGLFAFSDWRFTTWIQNQWRIRQDYIFAVFKYPNYYFSVPLLIFIFLLLVTDIWGHYKEVRMRYEVKWSPPEGIPLVPDLRAELARPIDEYEYAHKGFKYGKWLKGSETEKDVPGYKGGPGKGGH